MARRVHETDLVSMRNLLHRLWLSKPELWYW